MYSAVVVQEVLQRSLEDEKRGGQPSEVDNDQLTESIFEDDPLTTTWEVAKELSVDKFCGHLAFEANWKGEKTW